MEQVRYRQKILRIARGFTNKEIARKFDLHPRTISKITARDRANRGEC